MKIQNATADLMRAAIYDYHGQLDYQMEYKGMIGEPFDWLYLDFPTLHAAAEGEHYDYLARLTVCCPDA